VTEWRNRIIATGEESPDQLLANPLNFRRHPKHQQEALRGVLNEVGWVQDVIVNRTTGHLIDGHLRVELALRDNAPTVPVKYVDLSAAEEALILATFDPIGALANADRETLAALLEEVSTGEAAVQQMIAEMAQREGVVAPDFAPVGIDEQGRLDEKAKVTCPECGHVF
jgi:ParB-like chromosome segregation protein Spo0J